LIKKKLIFNPLVSRAPADYLSRPMEKVSSSVPARRLDGRALHRPRPTRAAVLTASSPAVCSPPPVSWKTSRLSRRRGCYELMTRMQKQAERFGAKTSFGVVESVDFSQRPFNLIVDGEKSLPKRSSSPPGQAQASGGSWRARIGNQGRDLLRDL